MPLNKANQRGFSLLEVLIAVVVVSVGFLATARMQIEGLRSSQNAYFLSQATFMMRDMADRMRANPEGISNGDYRGIETSTTTTWPACMTSQTECSATDIATADLASWSRYLHVAPNSVGFIPTLPSSDSIPAKGTVSFDIGDVDDINDDTYTISVFWSERIGTADAEQSLSMKVFP